MTKTFQVNVRRDGSWWYFEIPEIDMSGQTRKLSEVSFEATDVIATWLHVDSETIVVDLNVEIPEDAEKLDAAARAENAAIVDADQVERLRADADELADIRAVDAAWEEAERLEETPITWDDVKRDLGQV